MLIQEHVALGKIRFCHKLHKYMNLRYLFVLLSIYQIILKKQIKFSTKIATSMFSKYIIISKVS